MQIKNSIDRYGIISILFHWVMAILIIGMLAIGLYMEGLPKGLTKSTLMTWHKEYGILILMLVILRFIWRQRNILLLFPASLPHWQHICARSVHWLLYTLTLAMPLTGWLMSSAGGHGVSFFGWQLPSLMSVDPVAKHFFSTLHTWFAYTLIACIVMHTGAALMHHFINKDDVLRRMFF